MSEETPKTTPTSVNEDPAVKDAISVARNRRTDAMFVCAYLAVCALVYIVVWKPDVGEFAQGVVTLVLGTFLNELKNMYSFETGTTRASVKKDEAINELSKTAAVTANTAQVIAAAATGTTATNGTTPAPLKIESVNVETQTATITPKGDSQ